MAQFSVNAQRFDPYKNFKFRVKWDGNYVAGVSKVSALKRTSEVVEHLRRPREELDRLWSRLKPGGRLGIMTKQARDRAAFADWHYVRDRTHVCFFSRDTFGWLGDLWDTRCEFVGGDVVVFSKALS